MYAPEPFWSMKKKPFATFGKAWREKKIQPVFVRSENNWQTFRTRPNGQALMAHYKD
jgi:hypothetical protein